MGLDSKIKIPSITQLLLIYAALTIIGACAPPAANAQNLVANGSFEQPGYASDDYTMPFQSLATNGVTGWYFSPSGVTGHNYDGITTSQGGSLCSGNVEDGVNAAFVQGGSISQNVTLTAGSYTLSFRAMGRVAAGNGANPVVVTVENVLSNTVTPANTAQNVLSDWIQYAFNFNTPSNGTYPLTFQATIPYNPSDYTTFIDNVSIAAISVVTNGSFETVTPHVTSSSYTVPFGSLPTNAVANWTFGTSAGSAYDGVVLNDGALGVQVIEDGSNAAFVQGVGSISQRVALPAGAYALSFYAIGRTSANGGNGANPTTVSVGNLLNQTFTPDNTAENNTSDWILYSYDFTAALTGTYTVQFSGNDPFINGSNDHTTFIDNVSITAISSVPPPAIISEPSPAQVLYVGQTAQFTVQTTSTPPLFYQWKVESNGTYVNLSNGGRFSGVTNVSLIISNLNVGDSTNYQVYLTNMGGTTNSTVATLTVLPEPQPDSLRGSVTVINPSFEDSQQSGDMYTTAYGTLNPQTGVPGWQFGSSGGDSYSGIVTESGTTLGTPKYIPQCWQAAFIRGTGQFSQAVTFKSAGTNVVRFRAAGRSSGGAGAETIAVSVDGNGVGTFTPLTTQWTLYTSLPFGVTAGVHVVSFAGTIPSSVSDRTSFIDGVEIVTPAEAAVVPPISPVNDIVYVGDSITFGATLANPATQASAVQSMQSLGIRFNMAVRMSNQGHSGATTVDWLPGSSYFQGAVAAAAALETNQPGQLVFSIMLGANDSAQSGTTGAPVSATNYEKNLQSIIDQFLVNFPSALVFAHYPTWYSTNTHNGALYGPAGAALLKSYLPQIDRLVSSNAVLHPGHVFAGDKLAYDYFSTNYLALLTPESGVDGTFYLHPNAAVSVVLGGLWANAIVAPLNVTANDSYVAWLQSADMTPGVPGTGFNDTPTNSPVSNGISYGDPAGLVATLASNSLDVSGDIRNDTNLTVVLENSTNLVNWSPLGWPTAPSQSGVATGFIRHSVQAPILYLQHGEFYRLLLHY